MSRAAPIADAIRAHRDKLGLTQAQLAARWNMPLNTLTRWEQGARAPSPEGPIRRLMALDR